MTTNEDKDQSAKGRGQWDNKVEFFLSCLGYAVGLGNVWRFPFLVYKNGGAAFLIPYATLLVCTGLPMFFMELALGQYVSYGPNILFQKISPIFSGVGWAMVVLSFLTCIYYNLIIGWSFFYVFASFSETLPWGKCDNDFNSPKCYDNNEALRCINQSLHYYNRTCLTTEEYCSRAGLGAYNLTHCHGSNSSIIHTTEILAKSTPSEEFFQNRLLGMSGASWENMGGIRWEMVGCLALAWVAVALIIIKGIKSSGKVVYVTATFPYIILFIFFVRGLTLEGSYKGIQYYIINTNWTKLTEIEVWSDAASQIFYSLGVCFGGLTTLASYSNFNNNCLRDALVVGCSNCLTSVSTGFVIFSVLGFLANNLGVEVKDVATSGSGLVFVVYPAAISLMPLPQLWSVLFFIMLIMVGIGTQFTMMETVITAVCDQFTYLRAYKPLVVIAMSFVAFLMGLTMCLEGGVYMFELFTWHASGLSLIIVGIFQLIAVQYVYGFKKFMTNIDEMKIRIPRILKLYWTVTWLFLTPLCLCVILWYSLYFMVPVYLGQYVFPPSIQTLGWLICGTSAICIPIGAIWALCRNHKSTKGLFNSSPEFCPAHKRSVTGLKGTPIESIFQLGEFRSHFNKAFENREQAATERIGPVQAETTDDAKSVPAESAKGATSVPAGSANGAQTLRVVQHLVKNEDDKSRFCEATRF